MSEWRLMTQKPEKNMGVILLFGNEQWLDDNGEKISFGPVRDYVEKVKIAFFQDGGWYYAGTAHDVYETWQIENGNIPTRWTPLPELPE
jgi:hypothetical protein